MERNLFKKSVVSLFLIGVGMMLTACSEEKDEPIPEDLPTYIGDYSEVTGTMHLDSENQLWYIDVEESDENVNLDAEIATPKTGTVRYYLISGNLKEEFQEENLSVKVSGRIINEKGYEIFLRRVNNKISLAEGIQWRPVEIAQISKSNEDPAPTPPVTPVVEYDFAPTVLTILIRNAEGTDMLNPGKEETFLKDLVITYQGKDYTMPKSSGASKTRTLPATFYGMMLDNYWSYKSKYETGLWCVKFGEFESTVNVKNREIILSLGKDSTYQKIPVSYSNEFFWNEDKEPRFNTEYFVNGEKVDDESGKRGCFHFIYKDSGELEYLPSEYE